MPRSRNGSFSLRQLMSTLTANRIVRWPDKDGMIALTSDIPATGAVGALSYAAETQAAGRSAIDAEVSFTPGATLRTTLTGVGLERRSSDGSVWLNGKLKQAPATLSQRALSQRGLVPNGTCEIPAVLDAGGVLRAEGWSAFGVDTSNKIAGKYTIRRNTVCYGDGTDDFFSLSPGVTYGFYSSVYGGENPPAGANYGLALTCWDGEPTPQAVSSYTYQYIPGTAASLSRPLNVGDRSIYISKTGVTPGGYGGAYCYLTLYGSAGYVSPSGTQYKAPQSNSPLGFYSQWNSAIGFATPATITDLGTEYRIDIAADQPGWTIPNPAGGTWPAGTLCGATQGGDGNFFYPGPTPYRNFIPGAYDVVQPDKKTHQFKMAVYGTVDQTVAKNLPPGTTTLKVSLYLLTATDMRFQVNLYEVLDPGTQYQGASVVYPGYVATGTQEATSTTTGSLQLPGLGLGNGRGVFAKGIAFDNSLAASQINRSLYFDSGSPWYKLGDGNLVSAVPLSLPTPAVVAGVITVQFNAPETLLASYTVTSQIAFALTASYKLPGAKTRYKVIADGANTPSFGTLKESTLSSGYDGRNNVVNYIEFYWDGAEATYRIWQDKMIQAALTPIALTFPNKAGAAITQSGQMYTSSAASGSFWDAFMSSAQAIPANTPGRITVRCSVPTLIGLCDTNVAESYTSNNLDYYAFNAGNVWTGAGAAQLDSGFAIPNPGWIRLSRSVAGVVTCEASINGTAWTLIRTFAVTTQVPLYVTANLSGQKTLEVLSFEVG